jgi:hypothetical protein
VTMTRFVFPKQCIKRRKYLFRARQLIQPEFFDTSTPYVRSLRSTTRYVVPVGKCGTMRQDGRVVEDRTEPEPGRNINLTDYPIFA